MNISDKILRGVGWESGEALLFVQCSYRLIIIILRNRTVEFVCHIQPLAIRMKGKMSWRRAGPGVDRRPREKCASGGIKFINKQLIDSEIGDKREAIIGCENGGVGTCSFLSY